MAYQKIESHDEYLKIVEQYKDYKAGTYKSMTRKEKMDFFDGVHTDNVPLFDEDGDDMDTLDDYYAIQEEFLNHPEQFSLNDILAFIEMLDDSCYQPSFMDTITKVIHQIVRFYQLEGVVFLLSHLHEVPRRGYEFGLFVTIRRIMNDDITYPLMAEALSVITPDTLKLIQKILNGRDMPNVLESDGSTSAFPVFDECGSEMELERKAELENVISDQFTS